MRRMFCSLVAALVLMGSAAHAQPYPGETITIVGAVRGRQRHGLDHAHCRAQYLQAALGQSVVVENKVGASGVIAATHVARAAPDGYTLLMATNSTHSANPHLFKKLDYDPVKDFAPVARLGSYVFILVVNKDVPAKTLPELVAYAKANPGKLTFASGNTTGIVAGETLKSKAGIDVLHVPYKSTPPAINDVLGRPRLDDVHRSRATRARARRKLPRPRRNDTRTQFAAARSAVAGRRASRATTSPPMRPCSHRPARRRTSSTS